MTNWSVLSRPRRVKAIKRTGSSLLPLILANCRSFIASVRSNVYMDTNIRNKGHHGKTSTERFRSESAQLERAKLFR